MYAQSGNCLNKYDLNCDGAANVLDVRILVGIIFGGRTGASPTPQLTPAVSCLQNQGQNIVVSGIQSARYDLRGNPAPAAAKIDARTASWTGVHDYPVLIDGGSGICFSGGIIKGLYSPSTSWDSMHSTAAIYITAPNIVLENIRVDDYGDAIAFQEGARDFTIRGAYVTYNRDDCVENDWLYSGVVEDSLFDGCYQGFSTRTYSGQPNVTDGSSNTMTIRNTLMRMQPMEKVYQDRGTIPGHDGFFKWDPAGISPQLSLHNNIFRADQNANNVGLGIPPNKLASCSNNIMVWLGQGPYPEPLPLTFNGQPCFTITTDRSVWDRAVSIWKASHGY